MDDDDDDGCGLFFGADIMLYSHNYQAYSISAIYFIIYIGNKTSKTKHKQQ